MNVHVMCRKLRNPRISYTLKPSVFKQVFQSRNFCILSICFMSFNHRDKKNAFFKQVLQSQRLQRKRFLFLAKAAKQERKGFHVED